VIETLLAVAPWGSTASYYRAATGAEIDLVLTLSRGELWAIEIKRSSTPSVERGFHIACDDLKATKRFVVYPGNESFSLKGGIVAIGLDELARALQAEK
jgi:predicted AAA+ superfamily ATPase